MYGWQSQRQIRGRVTLAHALPEAEECWRGLHPTTLIPSHRPCRMISKPINLRLRSYHWTTTARKASSRSLDRFSLRIRSYFSSPNPAAICEEFSAPGCSTISKGAKPPLSTAFRSRDTAVPPPNLSLTSRISGLKHHAM